MAASISWSLVCIGLFRFYWLFLVRYKPPAANACQETVHRLSYNTPPNESNRLECKRIKKIMMSGERFDQPDSRLRLFK